ncbi:MAG: hypothetical protein FWE49_05845 [Synergistaceae bacterium]|nr:hypothetical protein [Synergistaceae bacterium]
MPRFILPQLERVYDTLDELEKGAFCAKSFGGPLSLTIQIILSVSLAYILTIWPVWCVLRYYEYVRLMDDGRSLYGITGFILCQYALAKLALSTKYRGFFMSVFHYAVAMGAYLVFIINPMSIKDSYPWLIRLVGFEF